MRLAQWRYLLGLHGCMDFRFIHFLSGTRHPWASRVFWSLAIKLL